MWPFTPRKKAVADPEEEERRRLAEEARNARIAAERANRRAAAEARILASKRRAELTKAECETRLADYEAQSATRQRSTDTMVRKVSEHASTVLTGKDGKSVQELAEEALAEAEANGHR